MILILILTGSMVLPVVVFDGLQASERRARGGGSRGSQNGAKTDDSSNAYGVGKRAADVRQRRTNGIHGGEGMVIASNHGKYITKFSLVLQQSVLFKVFKILVRVHLSCCILVEVHLHKGGTLL